MKCGMNIFINSRPFKNISSIFSEVSPDAGREEIKNKSEKKNQVKIFIVLFVTFLLVYFKQLLVVLLLVVSKVKYI